MENGEYLCMCCAVQRCSIETEGAEGVKLTKAEWRDNNVSLHFIMHGP